MMFTIPVRRMHSGFTLLELLVVLVLAAITVAVVGGGAQSYMERSRYHQTVSDIASLLVQARSQSVREGLPVTVIYDIQARQIGIAGGVHLTLPESIEFEWKSVGRQFGSASVNGEPLFIFNTEGGAQGGSLRVLRFGHGVLFRVNGLLGTVEQVAVQVPS